MSKRGLIRNRERDEAILNAWAQKKTKNEIAEALNLSPNLVFCVIRRARLRQDKRAHYRQGPDK